MIKPLYAENIIVGVEYKICSIGYKPTKFKFVEEE